MDAFLFDEFFTGEPVYIHFANIVTISPAHGYILNDDGVTATKVRAGTIVHCRNTMFRVRQEFDYVYPKLKQAGNCFDLTKEGHGLGPDDIHLSKPLKALS